MAAVLAAGGVVVATTQPPFSGDLRPPREGPMHVRSPRGARSRPGIIVHRAALHPRDITRRHGIPVTSAARTLLDLAATDRRDVDRALNEAGPPASSQPLPSMSSSAVTHGTEERQH